MPESRSRKEATRPRSSRSKLATGQESTSATLQAEVPSPASQQVEASPECAASGPAEPEAKISSETAVSVTPPGSLGHETPGAPPLSQETSPPLEAPSEHHEPDNPTNSASGVSTETLELEGTADSQKDAVS